MAGVLKHGFTYVYGGNNNNPSEEKPVMMTVYGNKAPTPKKELQPAPQQTTAPQKKQPPLTPSPVSEQKPTEAVTEAPVTEPEEEFDSDTLSAEEARIEREQVIAEYESLRNKYEQEAEQFVLRAREKATEIYEKTKEIAEKTVSEARSEAETIRTRAKEEGRKEGYDEGHKQGYDEGYVKALKKCKDTLLELETLTASVSEEKNNIYARYERQLFDAIFEIAQKVTLNSLVQKDKGVITKMIREAGKRYKTCKNVKIMLSALDISDENEIDEELLREVFRSSENIEIEIIPDAPQGTLIIDDGSEITDAGIMTQLKMIEQLGKGKYRDKKMSDIEESNQREPEAKPAAPKTRKPRIPKSAINALVIDSDDDDE